MHREVIHCRNTRGRRVFVGSVVYIRYGLPYGVFPVYVYRFLSPVKRVVSV